MEKTTTIDAFIAQHPVVAQKKMEEIRTLVKKMAPEATEAITYGIPTFKLNGNLIHFAAFKNHIGLYPGADGIAHFTDRFGDYTYSKGAVQFPMDKPLPMKLIKDIVQYKIDKQKSQPQGPASKKKK